MEQTASTSPIRGLLGTNDALNACVCVMVRDAACCCCSSCSPSRPTAAAAALVLVALHRAARKGQRLLHLPQTAGADARLQPHAPEEPS